MYWAVVAPVVADLTWQHLHPPPLVMQAEVLWQPHVPLVHVAVHEQQLPVHVRLSHGVASELVTADVCAGVAGLAGACAIHDITMHCVTKWGTPLYRQPSITDLSRRMAVASLIHFEIFYKTSGQAAACS